MLTKPRSSLVLLCSVLLALSCAAEDSTQLVVLMDTDYEVPAEVDRIRASVSRAVKTDAGIREEQAWSHVFEVSKGSEGPPNAQTLPATFGILPDGYDRRAEIVIKLTALEKDTGRALVSRRARTGFVREQARLVRMPLYRACADLSCITGQTCGCAGGTTCVGPTCIDEAINPQELENIGNPGALPADAGMPMFDPVEPDAGVPSGGPIDCVLPRTVCGGECIDTRSDPRHCGDCDNPCAVGFVCGAGECVDPGDCRANALGCTGFSYCDPATGNCLPGCDRNEQCGNPNEVCDAASHTCTCASGFHRCEANCVSDLDVRSCGASCTPCPAPANSSPTCNMGICDFLCDETYRRCGQMCCPACPPGEVRYGGTCAARHVQTVDGRGDRGQFTSIALDIMDLPQIAYYQKSGKNLRHASLQANGMWALSAPDTAGDVGKYASIAFDPAGNPHIAYYDASSKVLMFASRQSGGSWSVGVADGEEEVGRHASLAFDDAGTAHVSYYDRDEKDLMYARWSSGGSWKVERVDSGDDVGSHTSIAVGPAGTVHVSYYDETNKDLKYAVRGSDGAWTTRAIATKGDVGRYTSLFLDQWGIPHVSFYSDSNKDLLYASEVAPGFWSTLTVDSNGDVGRYASLALDGAGGPHISYYDEDTKDLKYARRAAGGSWAIQTVDSAGDVGKHTSIALDSSGHAHISYYDESRADLKYALIAAP